MNDLITFHHLLLPLHSTRWLYLSRAHFPYLKMQKDESNASKHCSKSTTLALRLVRKGIFHCMESSFALWLKVKSRNKEARYGKTTNKEKRGSWPLTGSNTKQPSHLVSRIKCGLPSKAKKPCSLAWSRFAWHYEFENLIHLSFPSLSESINA